MKLPLRLFVFVTFCFNVSFAQNCIVEGITAYSFTKSQSYSNAVADAQRKLVEDCGGGIMVSSNSLYSIQEDESGKVSDSFNESISLALSGVIKGFEVFNVKTELVEGGQIKTTLDAKGKVIEPIQSDLEINLSGLKDSYIEGDALEMQLTTNSPKSYVYVFQSVGGKIDLICPNAVQRGVFDENGTMTIPNDSYVLRVKVDKQELSKENNTYYVVGSTKPIPYIGDGSITGLINWYDELPLRGRCFLSHSVVFTRR